MITLLLVKTLQKKINMVMLQYRFHFDYLYNLNNATFLLKKTSNSIVFVILAK